MKEKPDLKIADEEIREIVNDLRKNGFPEEISLEEALKDMSQDKKDILSSLISFSEKEKKLSKDPRKCEKYDTLWSLREIIRDKLREAMKAELISLGIIKRQLVSYGAIPDPQENWKYYYLPNLDMACWDCGDEILARQQRVSIHDGPFPMSGSGRVRYKQVPYCPTCESTPPSSGIEKVDPLQEIAEDLSGF